MNAVGQIRQLAQCKICATSEVPVRFVIYDGQVVVRRCAQCAFTFVDHVVDEQHLETSEHNEAGVPDADPACARKWRFRAACYEKYCGPLMHRKVLDIGAGGGGWLAIAREAGAEVYGIEFCSVCRSFAKSRFGLNLEPVAIEDRTWRSRVGTFDLVTFWDVLEHVNAPRIFLQQCFELLSPAGVLMLSTPVRDTWFDAIGELAYRGSLGKFDFLLRQRYSHAHLQIFHSAQLRKILSDFGGKAVYFKKIHELSFPMENYFRNMWGNTLQARAAASISARALQVFPMANKVLAIVKQER